MKMHMFVELRMSLIAPNLCRIVGAGTAAMIVSQCGGLTPVAKMPACNVLILGFFNFLGGIWREWGFADFFLRIF